MKKSSEPEWYLFSLCVTRRCVRRLVCCLPPLLPFSFPFPPPFPPFPAKHYTTHERVKPIRVSNAITLITQRIPLYVSHCILSENMVCMRTACFMNLRKMIRLHEDYLRKYSIQFEFKRKASLKFQCSTCWVFLFVGGEKKSPSLSLLFSFHFYVKG